MIDGADLVLYDGGRLAFAIDLGQAFAATLRGWTGDPHARAWIIRMAQLEINRRARLEM